MVCAFHEGGLKTGGVRIAAAPPESCTTDRDTREDFTRDRNPADGERFQLRALQIRLRSRGVKLKLVLGGK